MNRLRELRKEKKLTTRELASKINLNYVSISRMENETQGITGEYISIFCKFFNVSSDYLLGLSDIRNPKEEIEKIIPSDFEYALFGKVKGLSDEQKKDLMKFIAFLKVKDEK